MRVPVTPSSSSGAGSVPCSESTAKATTTVNVPRMMSIHTIALRRSTRSVITPAGKVKTNHGNRCAAATIAISSGLRVIAVASQGYAIVDIPSPTLEMAVEM